MITMSNKWSFKCSVKLSGETNSSLQKIVQFYLWETPVPNTSEKGVPFALMGIEKSKYKTLQAEMRKHSGFPAADGHDWKKTTIKSIEKDLKSLDRLDRYDCSFEFAIHTVKNGLGKTEALFYFIRNAFAHGGFRISTYKGEHYFVLENRKNGSIRGRAILKESTLLSWAKLINDLRSKKKKLVPSKSGKR
ncbi:hypothetical protein QUW00_00055 [Collinsella tanakaei]|nr:hypothetical protein [Collinsella tanakaei]